MIIIHKFGIYVPIGEHINHFGTIVECFADVDADCSGCCFYSSGLCKTDLLCNDNDRVDKTMVKFKEISKE